MNKMFTEKEEISDLYHTTFILLLEGLESGKVISVFKKCIRLYLGFWGRSLYFFLGMQVFVTVLVVLLNKIVKLRFSQGDYQ